jgi:hypothetical protein
MYTRMHTSFMRMLIVGVTAGSLLALASCGGTSSTNASGASPTGTASSATPSHSPAAQSPAAHSTTGQSPAPGSQRPAQAPPAGYRWFGSSAQRLWLAVPKDWTALDLSKISISAAVREASLKAVATSALRADFRNLKQRHALVISDPASAVNSPNQFATTANVFCNPTVFLPGLGVVDALDSTIKAEYAKIGAHLVWLKNTMASSKEVIITTEVTAPTSGGYTVTEIQVADLTSQSRLCELTLSTDQPTVYLPIMKKIGTSLHAG